MNKSILAIHGGPKIRAKPFPYRKLFGKQELNYVKKVFKDSWRNGVDFGYQGKYEEIYTIQFCEFQGGGFADAVCSGTVAVYLALKALDLKIDSDVIVSPVTDPGSVTPVIMLGMNPVIADSDINSFNVGPIEFERALTPNTKAAILTHLGGKPIDMKPILEIAHPRGIRIIEDCSQAHGATYKGKKVGRFGDIAAFSTMFSKLHATGGCGGVVYTENEELYWLVRSHADRGKPFAQISDFDPKNPSKFRWPALNFNLDELSAAIGISTLSRLQDTLTKRRAIAQKINEALKESSVARPCLENPDSQPSVFFHTVEVDVDKLKVPKKEFAEAIAAEGIWINPDYRYVVSEWDWLRKYIKTDADTPNAKKFRDRTFNILLNERFSSKDIRDIVRCIIKVESIMAY